MHIAIKPVHCVAGTFGNLLSVGYWIFNKDVNLVATSTALVWKLVSKHLHAIQSNGSQRITTAKLSNDSKNGLSESCSGAVGMPDNLRGQIEGTPAQFRMVLRVDMSANWSTARCRAMGSRHVNWRRA